MSQNSIKNIGYTEERQIWKKFIWLTCCFSFNPKAERKDKYFLKQTTSTTTRTTKWAGLFYSKTKSCDADLSGHENISLTTFLSLHTNYITFDKMKKKVSCSKQDEKPSLLSFSNLFNTHVFSISQYKIIKDLVKSWIWCPS